MIKEYTKQVMHNAISHHLQNNAQPVPRQQLPPPANSPSFTVQCDIVWYGIPLRPVWVSCPGCVPSQLLVHPQPTCWQGSMRSWEFLDLV